MRLAEVGVIALGLAGTLYSACSSKSSTSQGSKQPTASNPAPSAQQPAIGGGPTEPGAAPTPPTPKGAVSSIAAAQCDREVRCNKVGQNQTYKTRDECVSRVTKDKASSINDKACTGGIDQGNLNRCVQSLRVEDCSNPISMFQRAEACKSDGMCLKKKK
jgi:hypothetical protein